MSENIFVVVFRVDEIKFFGIVELFNSIFFYVSIFFVNFI